MKNEDKTTPLEKLGYGLKYTLAISTAILAMCASCFIFISVTTYFAPPLQPIFDQERLGQLGDFLGGTLNPIFGFATVCLLLWSIFIQKKELSESTLSLNNQLKLAQNEYERKFILDLIKEYKANFYSALKKKDDFNIYFFFKDNQGNVTRSNGSKKHNSLLEVYTNIKSAEDAENLRHLLKDPHQKTPAFFTINIMRVDDQGEYSTSNKVENRIFDTMRKNSLNIIILSKKLLILTNDEITKDIIVNEVCNILEIQMYFIAKNDAAFLDKASPEFTEITTQILEKRNFDYNATVKYLESRDSNDEK